MKLSIGLGTKRFSGLFPTHRFLSLLFAVGLLAAALSVATEAQAQSYRFTNVSIEGNQRIEGGTILSQAGIARGETISAGQLNDAAQRIRASGLFEDVQVIPQGNTLVIRVIEYPTINRIAFEGNRRIKDPDLQSFIESEPRQVFSPTRVERDVAILTEAYEENGRVSARIQSKVIRRSDNRIDLVFEIFEGGAIEVNRVSFVGNRAYSDRRLRRVVDSKQAGILRAIVARDTFNAERLEFDKQVLRDFYLSRGYVDFRVTGTNAELAQERDGYFVTFNVQEGQQFRFGQITTTSEIPEANAADYQNVLRIRSGVVYSPTLVENSIARMERLAIRRGVDFLRVEPVITRNERDLTLDIEFMLVRGPRVFVERIDIEGNTTTLDRVIRRQFTPVEGDPFNPRQIREAAERIRALRYFEDVEVNAREGSDPSQVVVDVDVEETTTGTLSFGGSYSSDGGFGLTLGFSERNFLGRGQRVTAQISASADTANYNLAFAEPAFLGRDVEFAIQTSLLETDGNNALYDTVQGVLQPSLTFPVAENSRLTLYYKAGYQEMDDYVGVSPTLAAEVAQGDFFTSGVGARVVFDTRRTGLNPNAGVLLDAGVEYNGVGGDLEFMKYSMRVAAQRLAFNEEITLRASLEAGALDFMGGDRSRAIDRYTGQVMRGFDSNGMGPIQNGEHLGGNLFAVAKFDVEFPLGTPEEFGLSGGAFYDVGAIWNVDTIGAAQSTGFNARHVVGLSLFWESPFGPLRLNFSKALQKEPGDIEREFDITVRTEF
ncbi:outer membrane protein assembly factor BamA [Roseovarius sp. SK2]|uniref:outer membrane protein assembly factor BamA n=1 Tax=Roseovarius TaxID=74030 RepID=UPI00237B62EB|nr:outer membrane protein assembly factor BamA [Roseovarius sp. SK2]MDD9723978.1 outer membrane protein assembly factor BamA [Roseovarius sp. SK2]